MERQKAVCGLSGSRRRSGSTRDRRVAGSCVCVCVCGEKGARFWDKGVCSKKVEGQVSIGRLEVGDYEGMTR